ncbi:MAG: hypothetical protein IJU64_02490 [Bacilli bacterium]|nr:hypothetical protein [Bacilli bacterium]
MKKSKLFLRLAEIFSLIGSFVYLLFAAYAFSLRDPLYWLFAVLALFALFAGLALSSFFIHLPLQDKNAKIRYWIAAGCSAVSILPIIFAAASYLNHEEETVAQTEQQRIDGEIEEEPKPAPKKKWYKRPAFITGCVSLGMVLLMGLTGSIFESSGYAVSVTDFRIDYAMTQTTNVTHKIVDQNVSYAVTYYLPKFASEQEKVATVFVIPGFTRTKATMSQYAIELSKRGAAVFVIDPGSQGGSTNSGYDESGTQLSYAAENNGANYLVEYVFRNESAFPYLDRNRFGVIGHSAGGGNAVGVAAEFNGVSSGSGGFRIASLYVSGYIKTSAANKYESLRCNAANAYAYYDEGAYRYQTDTTSLEVINSRFINEVSNAKGEPYSGEKRKVVYDQGMGSIYDGSYRILHRETTNHCFEMYDGTSITNTISFFRETLGLAAVVGDGSHTWLLKEGSNGIAMIAGFTFICCVAALAVELPVLRRIKGKKIVPAHDGEYVYEDEVANKSAKQPSSIPSRFSFRGKALFWGTTVFSFVLACLDYIPLAYLSMQWFPDAANNVFTGFFPARMFNAVLLWAAVNGLVGLILFFGVQLLENLIEKFVAKKQGRAPVYDWSKFRPLRIGFVDLLLTIALALGLFFLYFGLVQLDYAIFHQDFRFTLISAAPLSARYLVEWLEYFPIIFIFYISNSIKVNCSIGMEGWKEWKVHLVGALSNSLALVFILIINYVAFFKTGTVFYDYMGAEKAEMWLYVNMVFALVPMMALLPILNRLFYKWTNRVYLGALVTCMIFVFMSLAASINFMPL